MANSSARSVVDVGSVIADTYKIEGLIGRGGMGAVFLASHARLPGKKVAIKVLHAELHDEELLARFKREAQIASMLGHPNIVGVHDFNVTPDGMPYLVLDFLEGETLAHKIQRGPVPLDQLQSILRQVGSALSAAHREGIVHRDLKPQNIFLVPTEVDGKLVEIAKVLDFGISKWRGSQTVKTQESALLGTPQYMAPEQATGKHDSVDARTDVFALGVIVHEMLTGQPAFSGASIPEVVFKVVYEEPAALPDSVPPAIASAVKQAMAKASEARFATVSAFVEAVTGQAVSTFRASAVALPEVGFATGSKRMTEQEALANTMGSGDYGPKVSTPLPSAAMVDVSAPTVDSQRGNLGVTPAETLAGVAAPATSTASRSIGSASTAAAPVATDSIATAGTAPALPVAKNEPPRKRTGLIVGLVGTVAVAGVIVAVVAMGKGNDKAKDPPSPTIASSQQPAESVKVAPPAEPAPTTVAPAEPTPPPPPTPTHAVAGSGSANGSAVEAATPIKPAKPAKPAPTAPNKPKPPEPPAEPEETSTTVDVGAMAGRLQNAFGLYRAGNHEEALIRATEVINLGTPRQAAKAHLLRGKIYCDRQDLANYNIEKRSLQRFRNIRDELLSYCGR